jgi:hypothetical protein
MPPRVKNPNKPAADDPGWLHYVEPYFGGGAVLLALDPEGISEVANDLDGRLMNFWRVLQNDADFARLQRVIEAVPFSERECRMPPHAWTIPTRLSVPWPSSSAAGNPWPAAWRHSLPCRETGPAAR